MVDLLTVGMEIVPLNCKIKRRIIEIQLIFFSGFIERRFFIESTTFIRITLSIDILCISYQCSVIYLQVLHHYNSNRNPEKENKNRKEYFA